MLDLLVVSVEAGLGLDQAIQRVGSELAFAYPELSDELRLINLELRAGKPRAEALRNLADRTGVDDLSSLVTMLIQTDKFGTSVAQSLRVYSETLRTKRRQRAEEAAAKTGVKMVFPLVFCIFPAIWVVTIGPAAIRFVTVLFPLIENCEVDLTDDVAVDMALIARNLNTGVDRRRPTSAWRPRARRAPSACCTRDGLEPGEALWIVPSRGVHTCGMRFTIDVLALDEQGVVIDRVVDLKPWRIRLPRRGTAGVLELPRRARSRRPGTQVGHRIELARRRKPMSLPMTPVALDASRPQPRPPTPPAPPATIAETGLHPDTLSQLMLKTLIAGEAAARGWPRSCACRTRCSTRWSSTPASRSWSKCAAPAAPARAGYRYIADRPRARPRHAVPRHLPLRRAGAGAAGAVQRLRPRLHGGAPVRRSRPPANGFEHLVVNQRDVRPARAGGELGQVAVPLRRARQRQDRRRGRHRPRARQRDVRAARHRRRRPDHHDVRSGQPRARRQTAASTSVDHHGGARPALGTDPAAGRRGRRRADARDARPDVQPDLEVLRSADPDEGQRRRVRRRRLRPPAHSAARPAEPLDRAAREPRRLPDAAHRPEVRDPVQRVHHLRDQPEAGVARRRSVPAPHPVQDPREEPDRRRVLPHLRAQLPQAAAWRSIR